MTGEGLDGLKRRTRDQRQGNGRVPGTVTSDRRKINPDPAEGGLQDPAYRPRGEAVPVVLAGQASEHGSVRTDRTPGPKICHDRGDRVGSQGDLVVRFGMALAMNPDNRDPVDRPQITNRQADRFNGPKPGAEKQIDQGEVPFSLKRRLVDPVDDPPHLVPGQCIPPMRLPHLRGPDPVSRIDRIKAFRDREGKQAADPDQGGPDSRGRLTGGLKTVPPCDQIGPAGGIDTMRPTPYSELVRVSGVLFPGSVDPVNRPDERFQQTTGPGRRQCVFHVRPRFRIYVRIHA
jgi:hypothetical protein